MICEALYFYIYGFCQISESLKRCGISDGTTYVLAARFGASNEEVMSSFHEREFIPD